jgi:hypothetical protein
VLYAYSKYRIIGNGYYGREKTDKSGWKAKTINNLVVPESGGVLKWSHQVGELMRQLPFDPEQLEVHVSNKIKILDAAREANQSFFGNLLNKFNGTECEKIELDGSTILQLFEIINDDPPASVDEQKSYQIDHQKVRHWYTQAFPDGIGEKGKKYFLGSSSDP